MSDENRAYDIRAIRDLLVGAFNVNGLRDLFVFAKDQELRPVAGLFGPREGILDMAGKAVEYCQAQLLLDELLAEVKEANPRAYDRFEKQLRSSVTSAETASPLSGAEPTGDTRTTIAAGDGSLQMERVEVVDVGRKLDKAADWVDDILIRRQEAGEDWLAQLRYDCDAVSVIIRVLTNLFMALVEGFKDGRITTDPVLLKEHVRQTEIYLGGRRVFLQLQELVEAITAAGSAQVLEEEAYGALGKALGALSASLKQFQDDLGEGRWTGVSQAKEWNLQTLLERVRKCNYGGGLIEMPLDEIAEQVACNRDAALVDGTAVLLGQVKALATRHPQERLDHARLKDLLALCQDPALSSYDKGKALENLSVALFSACYAVESNVRTETGEVDLYLDGRKVTMPFWDEYGDSALVECKNWDKPVGSREVLVLVGKCTKADSELGFFVSLGPFSEDALEELKGQNQRRGRSGSPLIVPVRLSDIEALGRYEALEEWLRTLVRLARLGRKGFYSPRYTHT